jgi:hypothetical protein
MKGSMKAVVGSGMAKHVRLVYGLPTPYGGAIKASTLFKGRERQLVGWDGKVLPLTKKVREAEVHILDPFLLNEAQHLLW